MRRNQAMTPLAQSDQVVGPVGIVRILSLAPRREMVDLQTVAAGFTTASTDTLLQRERCLSALLPILVMQQIRLAVPVMRQRADLFPSMRVQTTPRTEPHTPVVLFAHAQHPRFQGEVLSAFFTRQRDAGNPLGIGFAAIVSMLERPTVGFRWWKIRKPLRKFREGQAPPGTIFLARQQARLDDHAPAALLAKALHAAVSHSASISHRGDWD